MKTKAMNPADEPQTEDYADDHEVNGHLRTLMDAEMIKQDASKMKKVHALVGRHQTGMKSIADLKNYANAKFGPKKKLGAKAPVDSDDAE